MIFLFCDISRNWEKCLNLHHKDLYMKQLIILLSLLAGLFLSAEEVISQTPLTYQGPSSSSYTGWLFTGPEAVASDYTSFCQDSDGFLWIGTDRGLLRFEGNNYDTYTSDPEVEGSISDNRVLELMCDTKGRVWVATANGLNLYDPSTDSFQVMELPMLNFYGYIIALNELPDSTIIFVVSGVGLYVISEESGSPVAVRYMPNLQEEKNFNTLLCPADGKIYTGTRSGEICVIEPNGKNSLIKVSDNYIRDLALDNHGNILAADVSHIFRIKLKENNLVESLSSVSPIHILCLASSGGDTVYVGTFGEGLWCIEGNSNTVKPSSDIYSPFLTLRTANIGSIYCSSDGNIWLGCNYYGIVMIPRRQLAFTYRKLTDTFNDFAGGINALTTWKENVILGLDNQTLMMFSPTGKLLMATSIPGTDVIKSLTLVEGDKLIVGIENKGLYEVSLPDGQVSPMLNVEGTFPNIYVAPGFGDDLFVAVHGVGVMRYNRKTGEKTWLPIDSDSNRLTNSYVTTLTRTHDDKIWMGMFGGLACYDLRGDSLMVIDQAPFRSGASYAVTETEKGEIAIGTSHGLIIIDSAGKDLKKYTTADGLVSNDIRGLAIDRKGGLWISTLHGLSFLNPADSTFVSFHGGYGLVENSFRNIGATETGRTIYTSSNLGVTSFSPETVLAPGFGSDIKISGIYLNGHRLSPTVKLSDRPLVEGEAMRPTALYLPYKANALTLRLTTMDFRDGSNVQYRWQLEGYSKDWITSAPGESLIYLPHLDPGKYKLTIQAIENQILSEPLTVDINISVPWYLSWWAKLIYWLLFITLVTLLFIVWKRKRQAREDEARIKFFMDVSHDIRSPITLIMSPLESLMKEPFSNEVKMKLQTMHRNSQRILSLVNQLLELRKLEKGKPRLACRLTDMNDFVSELVMMFTPQASEKGLTLTFQSGEELPAIWVDRSNFDKILVNLISNAIKYTPKGGNIVVRNSLIDNPEIGKAVEVSVIDSGIGLDSKTEHRLFERFYQGSNETGSIKSGFGIGLDLCRRLVEFHHGVISGRNRTDGVKGSVFAVALPVGTASYTTEELIVEDKEPEEESVRDVVLTSTLPQPENEERPIKSGGQKTILVIDDDVELRDYICGYLGKHYKVKSAPDGGEALRIIADKQPDLIISDVMMPVVDGLTLLQRLKKNADMHHIPVIILSSKQEIADRMAGWDRGADGYLGKPFHIEELEALVENLIDNRLRMKGKFSGVQDTDGKIAAPEMKGNDEALLDRVMKVINQNIEDPKLNVEKLAQDVGLSRAHLHRRMKEMVGMTPSDFIRTIRMRRACELLRKGDVAVTQVAYKVGFTSQPHFSTIFKNFTGFTPSEYRDQVERGDVTDEAINN